MIRTLAAANCLAMRFLRSWAALALLILSCASVPASAQFARFSVKPVNCPQGLIFADGCVNNAFAAGVNNVEVPGFFGGYAAQVSTPQAALIASSALNPRLPFFARPAWNMPGIDYRVGVPGDVTLKDPLSAALPTGCARDSLADDSAGHVITCNGYNVNLGSGRNQALYYGPTITFDSWDFSLHGGVRLKFTNWSGQVVVKNSRIGASVVNADMTGTGWFVLETNLRGELDQSTVTCLANQTSPCVQLINDYIDGNMPGLFGTGAANGIIALSEGFLATNNYVTHIPSRFITAGTRHRPTLQDYCTFTYNDIEGIINPSNQDGVHGEVTLTNGPCGFNEYSYNTFLQPTTQGYWNGGSKLAQISAWIYPYAGPTSPTTCTGATSTGYTVSATGCVGDGATVRTPIGDNTKLVVTDSSGAIINGSITAVGGKGWQSFTGATSGALTFTMSQQNEIASSVSIKVVATVPKMSIHHNVFVNNMWNSGHTNFGALIGGLSTHLYGEFRIENNWIDATGNYSCFQPTGEGPAAASARAQTLYNAGNFNLVTGGKITDLTGSLASGCTYGIPNTSVTY